MKKIFNIVLFLLSFTAISAFGQVIKSQGASFVLRPAPNEEMPDSIMIRFFNGIVDRDYDMKNILLKKNANGSFVFVLPNDQPIMPFIITAFYDQAKRDNQMSETLYAEPSDKIEITFKKNLDENSSDTNLILEFSGANSTKYKVLMAINKDRWELFTQGNRNYKAIKDHLKEPDFYKSADFNKYLNTLFENIKADVFKQNLFITKNKKQLGENITTFYKYELGTYSYFRHFINILFNSCTNKDAKQTISNFYFSKIDSLRPNATGSLVRYSHDYKLNRSFDIVDEIKFKKLSQFYPFSVQYNELKKVKNNDLKQCVLTQLFTYQRLRQYISDYSSRDSCLNDVIKIVSIPKLKEALYFEKLFSKGSKVYPFSIPDTTGNMISLTGMKGKVFMLDFYAQGCTGCAQFAKLFKHEVYPEFANNPNFEVISVSLDQTKERWYSTMNSGLYTQKDVYINLNLGKNAMDHPMLKYYKVNAIPFVLLVDKNGKLIAKLNAMSSAAISDTIRKALKEPFVENTPGK